MEAFAEAVRSASIVGGKQLLPGDTNQNDTDNSRRTIRRLWWPIRSRDTYPGSRRVGDRVRARDCRSVVPSRRRRNALTYVGRPSPLSSAPRLSDAVGVAVYLKREDLNHTGAHKINNTVGQALLAQRMGKVALSRDRCGPHGVATATVCARFGLDCGCLHGRGDMRRQAFNAHRMRLMGAQVIPVSSGTRTLKDATSEAIRDWVTNVEDSYYIIGSVVGPAPYPAMVREFQSIIGPRRGTKILQATGRLPSHVVACVGGGRMRSEIFHAFEADAEVSASGSGSCGPRTRIGRAFGIVAPRQPRSSSWIVQLPPAG